MKKDKEACQRRCQKLLIRARLSDALQQELAVTGLVALVEEGSIDLEILLQLLVSSKPAFDQSCAVNNERSHGKYSLAIHGGFIPPDGDAAEAVNLPPLAVASAVCSGLETLVGCNKGDVGTIIKRLLEVVEGTLRSEVLLLYHHQRGRIQSVQSVLVATLANLSLEAMLKESSAGNMDAALLWCEQAPLVSALDFDRKCLMPLVFAEAIRLPTRPYYPHMEVLLVGIQIPVMVSILLSSKTWEKEIFLKNLEGMPLDRLPQPLLVALASSYMELMRFLPGANMRFSEGREVASISHEHRNNEDGTTGISSPVTDAQVVLRVLKLLFQLVCHLEAPAAIRTLGRGLAHHLVESALDVVICGSIFTPLLLPITAMLEALAEFDALDLLGPFLPGLAHLLAAMGRIGICGRERSRLLIILQTIISASNPATSEDGEQRKHFCLAPDALRLCLYPLLSLTSVTNAAAPLINVIERRLFLKKGSVLSSASGSRWVLSVSMEDHSWAGTPDSLALLVHSLRTAPEHKAATTWRREWALVRVMGLLFEEDEKGPNGKNRAEMAVDMLGVLVDQDNKGFLGPRLFPSILYRLNRCGMNTITPSVARLQCRLLEFLPSLGLHGVGAQLVQALLQRLASAPGIAEVHRLARSSGSANKSLTHEALCATSLGTAAISLSAALYRCNTRTLPRLRQLVLAADADMNVGTSSLRALGNEVDEFRLARVLAILDVVREDPEAGSEFVGLLQTFLMDRQLPGVVSTAVDCLTYLCSADCLDFNATLRIIRKEGRLNFKQHPSVLISLADFYGAGADIFYCSAEKTLSEGDATEATSVPDSVHDDYEERLPRISEEHLLSLHDHLWDLVQEPHVAVRRQTYLALTEYVPALLACQDDRVPADLRERVYQTLRKEYHVDSHKGLQELLKVILVAEAEDSGSWRRTLLLTGGAKKYDGGEVPFNKPSGRSIKALPNANEILQLYKKHRGDIPGLAGATLCAISGKRWNSVGAAEEMGDLSLPEMIVDVLSDENLGGRSSIHRILAVHGFLRFFQTFVHEQLRRYPESLTKTIKAIEEMETSIRTLVKNYGEFSREAANCYLALAALVNALPTQLSYKTVEVVATLREAAISDMMTGITSDVPSLFVSLGLSARCLGPADANLVEAIVEEVYMDHAQKAFTASPNWGWCRWGVLVGSSVAMDWVRQISSPDMAALRLLLTVTKNCLMTLQEEALHSIAVARMLREPLGAFSVALWASQENHATHDIIEWRAIDVNRDAPSTAKHNLSPSSDAMNRCGDRTAALAGALWGLAILAPNLAHAGLDGVLLQLYHVLRAAAQKYITLVYPALSVVSVSAVKANLLASSDVLFLVQNLMSHLTEAVEEESDQGSVGTDNLLDDANILLGVAHMAVSLQGAMAFPKGVSDDLRRYLSKKMRKLSGVGKEATSGDNIHETYSLSLYLSTFTLLVNGGPLVDIMGTDLGASLNAERTTANMTTELVGFLRRDVSHSCNHRQSNGAARILGLLAALKEEHDAEENEGKGGRVEGKSMEGLTKGSPSGSSRTMMCRIDPSTFGLPSEGTLLRLVLHDLLRLAVGEDNMESSVANAFIVSSLRGLGSCRTFKVEHKQMTSALQNLVKSRQLQIKQKQAQCEDAYDSAVVIRACIMFAVKMAPHSGAYVSWLYDFTVNSQDEVLDLVFDVLHSFIGLFPAKLCGQLLERLWDKSFEKGRKEAFTILHAIKFLDALGRSCKSSDSDMDSARIESVCTFVVTVILGFLPSFSSIHLEGELMSECLHDEQGQEPICLNFLQALANVLSALTRCHPTPDHVKEDLQQALTLKSLSEPGKGAATVIMIAMLIEEGAMPISDLKSLRHLVIGPATQSLSYFSEKDRQCLIPWIVRPLWTSSAQDKAAARREWILALLDYINVEPENPRHMVILVFLLTGNISGKFRIELDIKRVTLLQPQLRAALCRAENVGQIENEFIAEGWTRLHTIREGIATAFPDTSDADKKLEWGIQVVSRAVKALHKISCTARREKRLLPEMRQWHYGSCNISSHYVNLYGALLAGIVAGATHRGEPLLSDQMPPAAKRFIAEWCVIMSAANCERESMKSLA